MKPKTIGILGGAGPLAGAALFERVISLAGSDYGCVKDGDFPKIFLLSFPFSEMLTPKTDAALVQRELKESLNQLRQNGASILAIACNTLHAFLDPNEDLTDFIHLPKSITIKIPQNEIPLVLCTSTSRRFGLHKNFFACTYPNEQTQLRVDQMIDKILQGYERQEILVDLLELLQNQTATTVILGCTELSLFSRQLSSCNKSIIDPLEIVANKILETSFNTR